MTELSKILDFTDYSPGKAALKIKAAEVRPLDLAALAETEPVQKWFVVPAIAPCGEVTLCTGAGSAGKSLLWQQLCTALATGLPTLGIEFEEPMRAVYITCEDNEGELHWRQAHICKALGVPMGELGRDLDLISLPRDNQDQNPRQSGSESFLRPLMAGGLRPPAISGLRKWRLWCPSVGSCRR